MLNQKEKSVQGVLNQKGKSVQGVLNQKEKSVQGVLNHKGSPSGSAEPKGKVRTGSAES